MHEGLISIIVPVYNAEQTLKRCVDSLLKQSYKQTEIILVNDGSKDNSLSICKKYEKQYHNITVINKENGGVSSARNAGLAIARGEFIMFCDSDDWVDTNWCKCMALHYKTGFLIMCGYCIHYSDGSKKMVATETQEAVHTVEEFFELKKLGMYALWNKIFLSDTIKKNKIMFPESVSLGEDAMFVWFYLQAIEGKILCVQDVLLHYSWPLNDSLSLRVDANHFEETCRFYDFFIPWVTCLNGISEQSVNIFYSDCFWQFQKCIVCLLQEETSFHLKNKRIGKILNCDPYKQSVAHTIKSLSIYKTTHPCVLYFAFMLKRGKI